MWSLVLVSTRCWTNSLVENVGLRCYDWPVTVKYGWITNTELIKHRYLFWHCHNKKSCYITKPTCREPGHQHTCYSSGPFFTADHGHNLITWSAFYKTKTKDRKQLFWKYNKQFLNTFHYIKTKYIQTLMLLAFKIPLRVSWTHGQNICHRFKTRIWYKAFH